MKKIILLIVLFVSSFAHAQVLEARPFEELLNRIEKADFTYKETGKIFGFISTQSCLFLSEDIAIFKNYCFPVRKYPARGYTIITRESGIVDLYEEDVGSLLIRDIKIDEFPVFTAPYLQESLPTYTLSDLSGIIEQLYPRYLPGCWSTNFSKYIEAPEANCHPNLSVNGFESWATETQAIVNDEAAWLSLMARIEAKLVR